MLSVKERLPETCSVHLHDGHTMPILTVGSGKPVVLVHGFGMEASAWLPFALPLSGKYQFFMPYLRGFGKAYATPFSQPDFVADYVADIHAMREQLGLDEIALGGISMGSMTNLALHEAGYFSGVQRLLHIDQSPIMHNSADWQWGVMGQKQNMFLEKLTTLCDLSKGHEGKAFDELPTALKQHMIETVSLMVSHSFNNKPMQTVAQLMPKFPTIAGKLRNNEGWEQQVHIVKAYLEQQHNFLASATEIDIPVTVMVGGKSRLYNPEGQRKFASMLPNAKVVELPKAGHAALLDSPIESFNTIKAFLQGY